MLIPLSSATKQLTVVGFQYDTQILWFNDCNLRYGANEILRTITLRLKNYTREIVDGLHESRGWALTCEKKKKHDVSSILTLIKK